MEHQQSVTETVITIEDSNRNYYKNRVEQLTSNLNKFECYPHKFEVTFQLNEFREKFSNLKDNESIEDMILSVAGRIISKRSSSSKLFFFTIKGNGETLQIMSNFNLYENKEEFFELNDSILKRGDIVGVTGYPTRTKTGELSIVPKKLILLSPCYHNLPHPNTLTDIETRYRNKHLDLIVNDKIAPIFITRAKILKFIRNFYDSKGYIEVETPTLNILPGGANARPFITHHNDLHMNMFLRIAPELYLKQLVVGGLDKVYEIGKNFRNEGIDLTHNPEYTAIETYCAYVDYNDIMKSTEELLSSMVLEIKGTYIIDYILKDGTPCKIDFTPPFKRYSMIETLEEKLNVKFPIDLYSDETTQFLKDLLNKLNLKCGEPLTTVRLLDKLVGEYIEPLLINPGFITDHPQITSPLAKWHRSKPGMTERFELFIAGRELCNAYTELNNPFKQREMFLSEQKGRDEGDDEAQVLDEAFCTSLEYALPPTGGFGMGIDRLCMLLSNQSSIKEVILFPTMKPLDKEREAQKQMAASVKFALERFIEK
jgi:lysyl-tRNA synthetase, class II